MTDQETAAEHLRTIRSLMERATVYRAVSGPAALFGGIIAMVTGIMMALRVEELSPPPEGFQELERFRFAETITPETFFLVWVGVLALVSSFNCLLLWQQSKSRDEPFLSSGMKLAVRATLPPMAAGGLVSFILLQAGSAGSTLTTCALLWVVFYSLALLAAHSFAPRSMRWLGWMFFAAGMLLFALRHGFGDQLSGRLSNDQAQAGLVMALTFGALHVTYFVILFFRSRTTGEEEA